MTKKRLIATLIAVLLIIIIGVLAGVVFVVRDVEIQIDDEHLLNPEITKEDIIEKTNIQEGKSIFSISESKIVSNIESEFPTIRVRGVERVFPNKIIIHLVERVPLIAIKFQGLDEYLILDNNMCAMKKVECSEEESETKLKDVCIVKEVELSGQRNIYLGKQLPRIYGDEFVIVQDVVQGLINSGMGLNQVSKFLGTMSFDTVTKTTFIRTRYGSDFGVTIVFGYSDLKDEEMVEDRIVLAREAFVGLDTAKRAKGSLVYFKGDSNSGQFVYIDSKTNK